MPAKSKALGSGPMCLCLPDPCLGPTTISFLPDSLSLPFRRAPYLVFLTVCNEMILFYISIDAIE
jgi:hypothetical protein